MLTLIIIAPQLDIMLMSFIRTLLIQPLGGSRVTTIDAVCGFLDLGWATSVGTFQHRLRAIAIVTATGDPTAVITES